MIRTLKFWAVLGLFLTALCLMSWRAAGQTNVIFGNVGDIGMNPQAQVPVRLHLVYPNPRVWDNFQISPTDQVHPTDTNGAFSFTNIIWGTYLLTAQGPNGTSLTLYIWTNTLGSNAVQNLTTNSQNPAAYYSQIQSDARYIFSTNGGANGLVMTLTNGVWTPLPIPTLGGIAVAAGTNVTAQTNGAVVTLNAQAGGQTVAAGTNVTAQTNGTVVTINTPSSGTDNAAAHVAANNAFTSASSNNFAGPTVITNTASNVISGTLSGPGSGITGLTSANLTGALPAIGGSALTSLSSSALSGSLPALNGSALTSLTAGNLTGSHTTPDGVLSANVPLLNAAQTWGGPNHFEATTTIDGTFNANGSANFNGTSGFTDFSVSGIFTDPNFAGGPNYPYFDSGGRMIAVGASTYRTDLGLGTAAVANSSAFQPAATNLTNVANLNGQYLTNVQTTNIAANGATTGQVLEYNGTVWLPGSVGSGTVTSVGFNGDGTVFNTSVTGSPISGSGTFAPSLKTQAANTFMAGPSNGAVATPTFRAIVSQDVPSNLTNININGLTTSGISTYGGTNTFTNAQFPGVINLTNVANTYVGSSFTGNGSGLTNLTATNLTGNISPVSAVYSNAVPDYTRFYVIGSTLANINGLYLLAWTNSGSQQAVWTNTISTNIIYQNDTSLGTPTGAIEGITNDPNYFYAGSDIPPNIARGSWGPANSAPGTDNVYVTPGTNYTLLSTGVALGTTNTFPIRNTGSISNVVWVDPTIGRDTNIYTFGAFIQTISNACKSPFISYGGVMNLASGIYPETNFMQIPPNVVVNAEGAMLIGPGGENGVSVGNANFNIAQGDTINGLRMTNGNIYTPVQNAYPGEIDYPQNITLNHCYCHSGIDGLVLWNIGQGFRDFDCNYGSGWDAVYIGGGLTNSTVAFHNPYMEVVAPPFGGAANTTGMHDIAIVGYSGKLEIWGGTLICLGATNKLATQPNACIGLVQGSSTLSIVLHGTVCIYGSTNSGVTVSPIAYATGVSPVNVSGDYWDVTNVTGNLAETNMTAKHIYLNSSISVPTANLGTLTVTNGTVTKSVVIGNFSAANFTNTQAVNIMVMFDLTGGSTNFLSGGTPIYTNNGSLTSQNFTVPLAPGDYIHASATMTGAWRVFP